MVIGLNGVHGVNVVHLVEEVFRLVNVDVMILHLSMEVTIVLGVLKISEFATHICVLNIGNLHPGPHGC